MPLQSCRIKDAFKTPGTGRCESRGGVRGCVGGRGRGVFGKGGGGGVGWVVVGWELLNMSSVGSEAAGFSRLPSLLQDESQVKSTNLENTLAKYLSLHSKKSAWSQELPKAPPPPPTSPISSVSGFPARTNLPRPGREREALLILHLCSAPN